MLRLFLFFKQKTAYEMRISDWSSDVCSSDLPVLRQWLASGRRYVVVGDWNIAHRNIDLKNWRSNQKNSGFLPHERAWLDAVLGVESASDGWIDAYRQLHQIGRAHV